MAPLGWTIHTVVLDYSRRRRILQRQRESSTNQAQTSYAPDPHIRESLLLLRRIRRSIRKDGATSEATLVSVIRGGILYSDVRSPYTIPSFAKACFSAGVSGDPFGKIPRRKILVAC